MRTLCYGGSGESSQSMRQSYANAPVPQTRSFDLRPQSFVFYTFCAGHQCPFPCIHRGAWLQLRRGEDCDVRSTTQAIDNNPLAYTSSGRDRHVRSLRQSTPGPTINTANSHIGKRLSTADAWRGWSCGNSRCHAFCLQT